MSKRWLWVTFVVIAPTVACLVGLGQVGASSGSAHMDYGPTATTPWSLPNQSVASSSLFTITVYLPLTCKNFQPPIVLRVGGSGQYTTVQDAINAAALPYEYIVQVAQGTYQENIDIRQPKTIYLQWGWSADFTSRSEDDSLTVIDGGELESVIVIKVDPGQTTEIGIEGFTIQNGEAELGGGIHGFVMGSDSKLTLTLNNNTITENVSSNQGGGVFLYSDESGASLDATLTSNTLSENTANNEGGGFRVETSRGGTASVTLRNNLITRNRVTHLLEGEGGWDGGGLAAFAGLSGTMTVLLENNLITDNEAGFGGGVFGYAWGGDSLLDITLKNNIIAGNEAGYGGAIFSCSGKTCPVTLPGGSVFWTLINNTTAGNTATNGSDAIHLHAGSPFGDGGFITLSMVNDIVWGNGDSSGADEVTVVVDDGRAGTAEAHVSYSDIGSIVAHGVATYTLDHVLMGADPLFVDPANQDYLLQDGSPCIDAGDPNPAYNDGQCPPGRGTERGDMGAYGGPNNDNWP